MSNNTIPRDYVVTLRLQKLRQSASADDPVERVEVTAYDWQEAMMQAILTVNTRMGGLEDYGLQAQVLGVEPNCEKAAARTRDLLRDVSLVLMNPAGTA